MRRRTDAAAGARPHLAWLLKAPIATRLASSATVLLSAAPAGIDERGRRAWRLRQGMLAAELATVGLDVLRHRQYRRRLLALNVGTVIVDAALTSRWLGDPTEARPLPGRAAEVAISAACLLGFSWPGALATAVSTSAWLAVAVPAARRTGASFGSVATSAVAAPLTYVGIALLVRRLRAEEDELAALRQDAVDAAAETAAQEARIERDRILHDTALQTLEAVAGNWPVEPATLRARAAHDAELLGAAIGHGGRDSVSDLYSRLGRLCERAGAELGLRIAYDAEPALTCPADACEAILDATRELLVNVRKHAGTEEASVVATSAGAALTVTVSDAGCGFDTAVDRSGLGLLRSVTQRLERVGGRADILSSPGRGTTVTLGWPALPGGRGDSADAGTAGRR